jgi:hypothetical protein
MNLTIRGPRNADSFRGDLHPDLKADFILAANYVPRRWHFVSNN